MRYLRMIHLQSTANKRFKIFLYFSEINEQTLGLDLVLDGRDFPQTLLKSSLGKWPVMAKFKEKVSRYVVKLKKNSKTTLAYLNKAVSLASRVPISECCDSSRKALEIY